MFPSTLNRNLHKPTSGSKLRKSVTWDDLPPAIARSRTGTTSTTPTSAPAPPASPFPAPVQRQYRPTQPSKTAAAQEVAASQKPEDDTPTTRPFGSRNYIHPGWSLLRAEQIRKHILALEGQHARARGQREENGDLGTRRDSGFVDVVSGEMQVEYPELPDGNEEMEVTSRGAGYIGNGKGKERATEEGDGEQNQLEGMRTEYPSLSGVED